jgi:hypothetical protein
MRAALPREGRNERFAQQRHEADRVPNGPLPLMPSVSHNLRMIYDKTNADV